MKIALVSTEALITPPTKYGGIESMVYDLYKGLVEMGMDVTLFACNRSKSYSNGIHTGKLVEVIEEGWGKTGQCEEFERRIVNMASIIKCFDVVHDNSHQKPCWKIHKRVLNTMHWKQDPRQCAYNNVVAISNGLANWLRPNNRGRDVKVVHHGVDLNRYTFGIGGDRFLFLSAMTPAKGADITLEIAKKMNLEIDFAGLGGSTSGIIENEARKEDNKGNIRCLGEVTEEQKVRLYQNAKALIFPTGYHKDWEEPFGLVAIEAMSCGTPVITMNSGAMPEIVVHNKTGFICNNADQIMDAIRDINENKNKIKREDCRQHIERNFTYQAMAGKYIDLYSKLLNNQFW